MGLIIEKPTLIYDLECRTPLKKASPEHDIPRLMTAYSYITNKTYIVYTTQEMKQILDAHKYIVGFNTLKYDNVVLKNNGFSEYFRYNEDFEEAKFVYNENLKGTYKKKIDMDLLAVILERASAMKIKKGMLGDLLMRNSLDYIIKLLGLVDDDNGKIDNFDYQLFNKDVWTPEEKARVEEYARRDIEITKKLYEWLEEYFQPFKPFLNEKDNTNKAYLVTPISVFCYKAICNKLGRPEEYNSGVERVDYGGGFVGYPAGLEFHATVNPDKTLHHQIYCMDYKSAYPHAFMMCNLYSPKAEGWHGDGVFKVSGVYDDKVQGEIELLIKDLFKERQLNKGGPLEYTLKIVINTMYGLSGNPAFKWLFNPTTAADCTALVRQWIKLARKMYAEDGYTVIYTDTDSVYLIDNFDDKKRLMETKNKIINYIKAHVPFPADTFEMDVDAEITDIWFFKGKNPEEEKETDSEMDEIDFKYKPLGLMKKNYIYITTKGDLKYKNLGVKKKSTSLLTRHIFEKYIIPKIKEEKKVKFTKSYFHNLMQELMREDLSLIATRKKVNHPASYKLSNQLQAQIAKRYGAGVHFMIKNYKIGVGKDVKYCTMEEFKEAKMQLRDVDLSTVWSELEYFIDNASVKTGLAAWGI